MRRKRWTGILVGMAVSATLLCSCKKTEHVIKEGTAVAPTQTVAEETAATTEKSPEETSLQEKASPADESTGEPTKEATKNKENKETDAPETTAKPADITESEQSAETAENQEKIKEMEGIQPVLETIALYMEEGNDYNPKDDDGYYVLCTMLANNVVPEADSKACSYKDGELQVKQSAMEDVVKAAFKDRASIKEIPKECADFIRYDKGKGVYCMEATDKADAKGTVTSVTQEEDAYQVEMQLSGGDDSGQAENYLFTLYKNSEGSKYPYQVEAVTKAER